jgi:hypothetical protein
VLGTIQKYGDFYPKGIWWIPANFFGEAVNLFTKGKHGDGSHGPLPVDHGGRPYGSKYISYFTATSRHISKFLFFGLVNITIQDSVLAICLSIMAFEIGTSNCNWLWKVIRSACFGRVIVVDVLVEEPYTFVWIRRTSREGVNVFKGIDRYWRTFEEGFFVLKGLFSTF